MKAPWIDAKVTPIPTGEWILIYVPNRPWGYSSPGDKHKVKTAFKYPSGIIREFGPDNFDEREIAAWMPYPDPSAP